MKRTSLPLQRRQFISLLGSTAAWPLAARAQQSAMPVIGFLNQEFADVSSPQLAGFCKGLSETGFAESRVRSNIAGPMHNTIDCRSLRPSWSTVG